MTTPDSIGRLLNQTGFAVLREHYRDKEQQLIFGGQQSMVRVDAYPDQVLRGQPTWDNWDGYTLSIQWANGAVGSYASTYALRPGLAGRGHRWNGELNGVSTELELEKTSA